MPDRLIGRRYQLEQSIGSGGMGAIWIAQDLQLQRRVALKLMQPEHLLSPAAREQFAQEAQAIARLQHTNVVQIHDYGIDQDGDGTSVPFIVMELLTGEDLATRLTRRQRLDLESVVPILAQVARALFTAHSVGLVHRDIKPANIFLARSEGAEVAKLLDFGVAATMQPRRDSSPDAMPGGTPYYMSPEQILQSPGVDHRSDLFSLGIVAYELLTGRRPFHGTTLSGLVARIASGEPVVPPSHLEPSLGDAVDRFFEKALAHAPTARFQSAREMTQAFSALLDATAPRRRIRVLVVDDELDVHLLVRHRFRRQIREAQYEFLFASDGQQALEVIGREPNIDVVLSDINMPIMDGIALLQRTSELDPLLKVVIVSAYGDMRNIRTAMNRGAFDFVTKPIDFQDLSLTIDKTAQHVQAARVAARWAEENVRLRHLVGGVHERWGGAPAEDLRSERCEVAVAVIRVTGWETRASADETLPADLAISRLNGLLDVIFSELAAYGGVIDTMVDSAVVALFRGPDHVYRALAACLALRTRWPDAARAPHGVAMGVGTGEAYVAGGGARPFNRVGAAAVGGAVGQAVELGMAAEQDQILVPEALRERALAAFSYERVQRGAPATLGPVTLYNLLHGKPGLIDNPTPRAAIEMDATLLERSPPPGSCSDPPA